MITSHATSSFPSGDIPTVFDPSELRVPGTDTRLMVRDTAGHDDYNRLRKLSYPGTDVFIVCFSFVDERSLLNINERWIPEIREHCPSAQVVIVGTKSDLWDDEKLIPQDKVQQATGGEYYPCSALSGAGLPEVFSAAVRVLPCLEEISEEKSGCALS